MNSFRSVERAIAFEIERQAAGARRRRAAHPGDAWLVGRSRARPTTCDRRRRRTTTATSRSPTCRHSTSNRHGSRQIAAALPELPAARRHRFTTTFGLSAYDAAVLVADRDAATLFEAGLAADPSIAAKSVANWVTGEYLRLRNAASAEAPVSVVPSQLAALVSLVDDGAISRSNAKDALAAHAATGSHDRGDRRRARLPADLGYGCRRCGRRRGAGRQRRRGRRLPRGQDPGRRLPGRPGHEGDPRPGRRRRWSRPPDPREARRMTLDQRRSSGRSGSR